MYIIYLFLVDDQWERKLIIEFSFKMLLFNPSKNKFN